VKFYPGLIRACFVAICGLSTVEGHAASQGCARVTRDNLIDCALSASLSSRVERQVLDAARAREESASVVLPSNPVLSAWAAQRRTADQGTSLNWSATLAQEVEIGGQRGQRRRAAAFDRAAQVSVLQAANRDAAAEAWRAYFDAIAAEDELTLVKGLEGTVQRVAVAAKAAADKGLIAGVDADVADAGFVRIEDARARAERRAHETRAVLLSALGRAPAESVELHGDLVPLAVAESIAERSRTAAPAEHPEVRALEATSRAERSRADLFRRLRIPNPTVSVFIERGGFAEQVLGVGIALPLPLPQPIGRSHAGEIAESEALARASATRAERLRREVTRNMAMALAAYEAGKNAAALYTPERRARAEQALRAMAQEIESGRLGVRDAVLVQETLLELLAAGLTARRALCLASVDLARAAGAELERGAR
jgi:cobalt-zinc-cadmium efflux system outer membrane protein